MDTHTALEQIFSNIPQLLYTNYSSHLLRVRHHCQVNHKKQTPTGQIGQKRKCRRNGDLPQGW
jgi:hypothetical protein